MNKFAVPTGLWCLSGVLCCGLRKAALRDFFFLFFIQVGCDRNLGKLPEMCNCVYFAVLYKIQSFYGVSFSTTGAFMYYVSK